MVWLTFYHVQYSMLLLSHTTSAVAWQGHKVAKMTSSGQEVKAAA